MRAVVIVGVAFFVQARQQLFAQAVPVGSGASWIEGGHALEQSAADWGAPFCAGSGLYDYAFGEHGHVHFRYTNISCMESSAAKFSTCHRFR